MLTILSDHTYKGLTVLLVVRETGNNKQTPISSKDLHSNQNRNVCKNRYQNIHALPQGIHLYAQNHVNFRVCVCLVETGFF